LFCKYNIILARNIYILLLPFTSGSDSFFQHFFSGSDCPLVHMAFWLSTLSFYLWKWLSSSEHGIMTLHTFFLPVEGTVFVLAWHSDSLHSPSFEVEVDPACQPVVAAPAKIWHATRCCQLPLPAASVANFGKSNRRKMFFVRKALNVVVWTSQLWRPQRNT
jgi:hypothetical protein